MQIVKPSRRRVLYGPDDNPIKVVDVGGSENALAASGPAAENAAVAGNPLLAGGRYDASDRTLDDGDVGGIALDDAGRPKVVLTGSITPTHTTATVTTASGEALAANTSRKYALLINDSDVTIYLKIGVAAVLNEGIRLNANGGSYELATALGNLATGAINAIHGGSGDKVLTVLEGE